LRSSIPLPKQRKNTTLDMLFRVKRFM